MSGLERGQEMLIWRICRDSMLSRPSLADRVGFGCIVLVFLDC